MLSRFGYRKIAVVGAIFISSGLMLTSVATDFWHFILSYSIICCEYTKTIFVLSKKKYFVLPSVNIYVLIQYMR